MPQEKYHSLAQFATKKIAIVEVSGAIMEGEDSFAEKQIDRVRQDPDVVGVVVRVNSPGGTVTGSDFIYHHLRELAEKRKLPIVVSMGSVCASGGYYVAMAVGSQPNTIFAEPATWTGSIGVIIPHFDVSGGLAKLGISEDSIASGPLKKMGSPTRPMIRDREKDYANAWSTTASKTSRRSSSAAGRSSKTIAAGTRRSCHRPDFHRQASASERPGRSHRLYRGRHRAGDRTGRRKQGSVRCVKYEKRPYALRRAARSRIQVQSRSMVDLSALIDVATPRAYYLWSWLPAALSNSR